METPKLKELRAKYNQSRTDAHNTHLAEHDARQELELEMAKLLVKEQAGYVDLIRRKQQIEKDIKTEEETLKSKGYRIPQYLTDYLDEIYSV